MIGKEERKAVLRVMDRGVLSGYRGSWGDWFYGGEEIQALEKEWAKYFGVKHAIACNSATSGLWLACAAIGLKPKGYNSLFNRQDVIVTPYSMTCSASMPLHFGACPVFADIEPDYFCLDPKSIERRITEYTRAIIVVDLFGMPADYDEINFLAAYYGNKYGHKIYVIEDAAQACGAKYKGRYAGTLGDIGIFSLNVHKHIQCGEGGIVVTDNDELAFKIRLAMNHSEAVMNDIDKQNAEPYIMPWHGPQVKGYKNYFDLVGMNMRMTEISAAIAREQLKKLAGILAVYQENAKQFPVKIRPGCESAFYKYAWNWNDRPVTEELINNSIMNFKRHYITPLYKLPLFQQLGYDQHQCPVCEEIEENIVLAWFKDVI